jgi:hypothetical protein
MSPGAALDAAVVQVDAMEKVNVRGAPARVEEIARSPEADDLKATDEGWPFAPPPDPPRFIARTSPTLSSSSSSSQS